MPPRRVRLATSFAGEMRPFIAPPTPQGAQTPHPLVGDDVRSLHYFGRSVSDSSRRHLRGGLSPAQPASPRISVFLCVHRVSVVKEFGWEPQRHDAHRDRGSRAVPAGICGSWLLSPPLANWQREPALPPSTFPGIIRHCQHSTRRHGRLSPDLPCRVCLRGPASPDVRDGTSLLGGSLSEIQRRSAELGIALPDVPPAVRHFTAALPHLRQPVRHFGDAIPSIRQLIRHFTDVLLFIRQSIRHFGDAVLWLFDHFPQLSVSVR